MDALAEQVIDFVADFTACRPERIQPSTTLFGDLGMDGDDGGELLSDLAERFGVDLRDCQLERHFGPEGLPPWFFAYWLVLAFRKGTPEQKARLLPITVADLIESARLGRWWCGANHRLQLTGDARDRGRIRAERRPPRAAGN